jgi:hypothetical protein
MCSSTPEGRNHTDIAVWQSRKPHAIKVEIDRQCYVSVGGFLHRKDGVSRAKKKQPKIIYHVPPDEAIEKVAFKTCLKLAERDGQECYPPEVMQDFAAFLKTMAKIHVKHLNSKQSKSKAKDNGK